MKVRLISTAALVGALAATSLGAQAGSPVLDGKKVKSLTLKVTPAAQSHDSDFVTGALGGPERVDCAAPRCARLPFVFTPARGVKGDLVFELTWGSPSDDLDLYVAEIGKDGSATELAHCGAAAGTSERIAVASSTLKVGKTYALIADFYRSTGSAVTGKVSFPAKLTSKTTAPSAVDSTQPINCGL